MLFVLSLVVCCVASSSEHVSSSSSSSSVAFVTLLSGDDYVWGARVLGLSLREVRSAARRVCLVTHHVSHLARSTLVSEGWTVREIVPMQDFAKGPTHWRWQHAMTKLRLWELVDWDTIVFVDADYLFLKNPDRLFECPGPICASPDMGLPDRFGSGIMVIKPNMTIFKDMMNRLGEISSYDNADQGFLNTYFRFEQFPPERRLSKSYNGEIPLYMTYPAGWNEIKNRGLGLVSLHFNFPYKPWHYFMLPVIDLHFEWHARRARLPESRMDATPFSVVLIWLLTALLPIVARAAIYLCEKWIGSPPAHKKYELGSNPSSLVGVVRPRGDVSVLLGLFALAWGALGAVLVLDWATWPTTAWGATWAHVSMSICCMLACLSVLANRAGRANVRLATGPRGGAELKLLRRSAILSSLLLVVPVSGFAFLWELCKSTMSQHELHIGVVVVVVVVWLLLLFLTFLNVPQMCYRLGKMGVSIEYATPAWAFLMPIVFVLVAFVQVVLNHAYLFFRLN